MRRAAVGSGPLVLLLVILLTGLVPERAGRAASKPGPSPAIAAFPALRAGARLLIVAPHPDDETLGCGGLMQQALAAGAEVHVAIVTNGDAAELSLIFGEHELPLRRSAFQDLGRRRQQEALRALDRLGLPRARVHFLGYPNNGMLALWRPEHWPRSHPFRSPYTGVSSSPYSLTFTPQAPYAGQQVMSDLVKLMEEVRPTAVFVTHPRDVHPDHWSTASFTRFAVEQLAARKPGREPRVYGFLIHWPDYPAPRRLRPNASLQPPPQLANAEHRWLSLPLTDEQQKRKLAAIKIYQSQLPAFDRLLLSFDRRNELFEELSPARVAPDETVTWGDEDSGNRRLGGAEVTGVRLRLGKESAVVDISARVARMPKDGYIAFDLRTPDGAAGAQIVTAYLALKSTEVTALTAQGEIRALPLVLNSLRSGLTQLPRLPLPTGARLPRRFFVTCWGSRRDRMTDPAVNTLVEK